MQNSAIWCEQTEYKTYFIHFLFLYVAVCLAMANQKNWKNAGTYMHCMQRFHDPKILCHGFSLDINNMNEYGCLSTVFLTHIFKGAIAAFEIILKFKSSKLLSSVNTFSIQLLYRMSLKLAG